MLDNCPQNGPYKNLVKLDLCKVGQTPIKLWPIQHGSGWPSQHHPVQNVILRLTSLLKKKFLIGKSLRMGEGDGKLDDHAQNRPTWSKLTCAKLPKHSPNLFYGQPYWHHPDWQKSVHLLLSWNILGQTASNQMPASTAVGIQQPALQIIHPRCLGWMRKWWEREEFQHVCSA